MEKSIINKKILCPVCGKYYFEELTVEEIEDGITPEDDFCTVCGWNYDEKQLNGFDLKTNLNEKSINEYKKWFENQKSLNPNYNFLDANKPQPQHLQYVKNMNLKIYLVLRYVLFVDGKMMEQLQMMLIILALMA